MKKKFYKNGKKYNKTKKLESTSYLPPTLAAVRYCGKKPEKTNSIEKICNVILVAFLRGNKIIF